ncbi:hypothetical protein LLE87_33120, partial [Paenibacillus polymyxa]|nr:hypothetical protein [Paenibacillus polymyxa]
MFHALSRDDIRAIVRIQLQRVVRTAAAQDISLTVDESLVDHLVDAFEDLRTEVPLEHAHQLVAQRLGVPALGLGAFAVVHAERGA